MPCFVTTETEGSWNTVIADGHFMLEDNNEGITNGTLIIMDIKIEDRDNYMCYAINELGSHNSTTLIRVIGNMPKKFLSYRVLSIHYIDKYAALWPFLGICVEVIVLCAVIFVCERRRNKKQFEESDNEQNNT